jgi:hypothetical protein
VVAGRITFQRWRCGRHTCQGAMPGPCMSTRRSRRAAAGGSRGPHLRHPRGRRPAGRAPMS